MLALIFADCQVCMWIVEMKLSWLDALELKPDGDAD